MAKKISEADCFVRTDNQTYFQVDRRAYTSRALWQQELQCNFNLCWLYACHASELVQNNSFLTRQIGGRPVLYSNF